MLTHLEPQDPKNGKNATSTKHCKTREFLATRGGSAAGGPAPLSYGEERTAVRQCHGQGAPVRIKPSAPSKSCNPGSLYLSIKHVQQNNCYTGISPFSLVNPASATCTRCPGTDFCLRLLSFQQPSKMWPGRSGDAQEAGEVQWET